MPPLVDRFGRVHDNLRLSVTDRCNIRCFYCMPEGDVTFLPREELLTFEELERFVVAVIPLGIRKLRLTGGEPLVRKNLAHLVRRLVDLPGIDDVGLTTNGMLLADQAEELYAAGLRRLNISLDALSPEKFRQFARRDGFDQTMAGIQAAQRVGFQPIKINAVSVRGMSEPEIVPFGHFARSTGLEVRFIEYMPLDAENAWQRDKVLFASEILERLSKEFGPLKPTGESNPHAPAVDYEFADGVGRIGFIASVSQPFCASCNRIRLTAEGKLRNCLFSQSETDIRALLRGKADDAAIQTAVQESVLAKEEGHEINAAKFIQPLRPMYAIGG